MSNLIEAINLLSTCNLREFAKIIFYVIFESIKCILLEWIIPFILFVLTGIVVILAFNFLSVDVKLITEQESRLDNISSSYSRNIERFIFITSNKLTKLTEPKKMYLEYCDVNNKCKKKLVAKKYVKALSKAENQAIILKKLNSDPVEVILVGSYDFVYE